MSDSEIKHLFKRADAQVHIDEKRKQMAYQIMLMEMENQGIEKQRIETRRIEKQEIKQQEVDIRGTESRNTEKQEQLTIYVKNILLQQFQYMDKLFFYVYGGLICLGIIFIAALQHIEVNQNEIITVCMVGAGILSIISIGVIDKMFFGKMAELGATCYLSTKQCVAIWMVLSGMVNVVVLFSLAGYLNGFWRVDLLRVVLYILTPYLLSAVIALGILSMEAGRKHSYLFVISGIFLSIGYGVIGTIPGALLAAAIWLWAATFIVSIVLSIIQIKRVFNRMEKGDVLCMN